jgi:hypothetical protein
LEEIAMTAQTETSGGMSQILIWIGVAIVVLGVIYFMI